MLWLLGIQTLRALQSLSTHLSVCQTTNLSLLQRLYFLLLLLQHLPPPPPRKRVKENCLLFRITSNRPPSPRPPVFPPHHSPPPPQPRTALFPTSLQQNQTDCPQTQSAWPLGSKTGRWYSQLHSIMRRNLSVYHANRRKLKKWTNISLYCTARNLTKNTNRTTTVFWLFLGDR